MKDSIVLLMLLAPLSVLSHPQRQKRDVTDDAMCDGMANFVRLPGGDCTRYYQCYSGQAYSMQCPEDTWFNEVEQICDDETPPEGCNPAPDVQPPVEQSEDAEDNPQQPEEDPNQTEECSGDDLEEDQLNPDDSGYPEESEDVATGETPEEDIQLTPDQQESIPIIPDDSNEPETLPEIITDDISEGCSDEGSGEDLDCTYSGSGDDGLLTIPVDETETNVEPLFGEEGSGF